VAGPGGILPGAFTALLQMVDATALRAGQQFRVSVQGSEGNLWLNLGGTRVPLNPEAGLLPAQHVSVEVFNGDQGLQLRVTPQAQSGEQAAAPARLSNVLTTVLDSLGALSSSEPAASVVPARMPPSSQAVRQLVELFVARSSLGADLQAIQILVTEAATAGAIPQATNDAVATLVARLLLGGSSVRDLLAQLEQPATAGLEARMAQILSAGSTEELAEALGTDVRALLARVREEPALLRFLQSRGQVRAFQGAVDRVIGRFTGEQLQNLHSIDNPYRFLEMPVPAESPFQWIQLHFFGDGEGGKRGFGAADALVVLDVSTTALGDLWISLGMVRGLCTCTLRATDPATVKAIASNADELKENLAAAGYQGANVQAVKWNGDRLLAAAQLMRRFSGMDMRV
jgi:Flagellar hook-length control protein FliK